MQPEIVLAICLAVAALAVIVQVVRSRRRPSAVAPDRDRLFSLKNEWRPPPELSAGPVPRTVYFTWPGRLALMVGTAFLVGLGVVGVLFYQSLDRSRRQFEELQSNGATTPARILDKSQTGSGKNRRHFVSYEFEAGGQIYRRRVSVSSSIYGQVQVGRQVAVVYLPYNPQISRLAMEGAPVMWVAILPPAFLLLLAVLMVVPVFTQRKLAQYGQAAPAVVTRTARVKNGTVVYYDFLDEGNNIISGRSSVCPKAAPEPGAVITVLFHSQNSRRNVIYPPQLAHIANPFAPEG
jgi:hypothetical protein